MGRRSRGDDEVLRRAVKRGAEGMKDISKVVYVRAPS
jgi:hypothetical protein